MNTTEFAFASFSALAGGGFVAGAIILRPALSDLAWALREGVSKGYSVSASVSVRPPAVPKSAPVALNGIAVARAVPAGTGPPRREREPGTGYTIGKRLAAERAGGRESAS